MCPGGPSLSTSSPHRHPPEETTALILCSSFPYYNYCTYVIFLNDVWFCFACFEPLIFFFLNIMFLRFIHIDNYSYGLFISLLHSISYELSTFYLNILLLKDVWVVSSLEPLEVKRLSIFQSMSLIHVQDFL